MANVIEIVSIGFGFLAGSGLIALMLDKWYDHRKARKDEEEKKILTNPNSEKILTDNLVKTFSPERNYKKVKEILGEPDKMYDDFSIFEGNDYNHTNSKQFQSDLYFLKNAILKITTYDKISICSITVFPLDDFIEIPYYDFFSEGNSTNESYSKISKEFIDAHARVTDVRTIREWGFAIQTSIGPPFYKYLTLFSYSGDSNDEIENCIGMPIDGFCLSDDEYAFYIYEYEQR